MRHALMIGLTLLCFACGDDTADQGTSGDGDAVEWACTCWNRADSAGSQRFEETFTRCSAEDPTEAITEQHETAVERAGRIGGCEDCERTGEACTPDSGR